MGLTQADVITILIDIMLTYAISLTLRVGVLSIAPVAFQGIGAYAFALLTTKARLGVPVSIVLATAICLIGAILLSVPLGRVKGLYASIATLAVVVIATGIESGFSVFGGSLGIAEVPYGDTRLPLVILVVLTVIGWFWLDRSPLGRKLDTVGKDITLAATASINVGRTRSTALIVSNTLAGLVGAFWAHSFYFVSPDSFDFFAAVQISAFAIVAGATYWASPLIAGGGLALLASYGSNHVNETAIATGVLMVIVLVLWPGGLGGGLRRLTARWRTYRRGLRARRAGTDSIADRLLASSEGGQRNQGDLDASEPLVTIAGVSKSFGGVHALVDIEFTLPSRGVVGIIGPNGSGKSTLLATISGLLAPDDGRVAVAGKELAGKDAVAFARVGVARTFQQPRLVPDLKVWENLVVGSGPDVDAEALRRVADAAGVAHTLDKWPDELPTVLTRRIEVARALLRDPKVLLMDEPAAGLTEAEARSFSSLVTEVGHSRLVVVVEHNMNVISAVADRVIALVEGHLIADDRPQVVQAIPRVRSAYLGLPTGAPS